MVFKLISQLEDKSAAGIVKAADEGVIAEDARNSRTISAARSLVERGEGHYVLRGHSQSGEGSLVVPGISDVSSPLLVLQGRIGMQPQRDVSRLHRLPHYPHQFVIQRLQVRLIPQFRREGF